MSNQARMSALILAVKLCRTYGPEAMWEINNAAGIPADISAQAAIVGQSKDCFNFGV